MGKKIVHVEFPAQDLDRAEKFSEAVGGKDTEGNSFGLFQSDESVTMPEGVPGA